MLSQPDLTWETGCWWLRVGTRYQVPGINFRHRYHTLCTIASFFFSSSGRMFYIRPSSVLGSNLKVTPVVCCARDLYVLLASPLLLFHHTISGRQTENSTACCIRHGTAVEYCLDTSAWCEYSRGCCMRHGSAVEYCIPGRHQCLVWIQQGLLYASWYGSRVLYRHQCLVWIHQATAVCT